MSKEIRIPFTQIRIGRFLFLLISILLMSVLIILLFLLILIVPTMMLSGSVVKTAQKYPGVLLANSEGARSCKKRTTVALMKYLTDK